MEVRFERNALGFIPFSPGPEWHLSSTRQSGSLLLGPDGAYKGPGELVKTPTWTRRVLHFRELPGEAEAGLPPARRLLFPSSFSPPSHRVWLRIQAGQSRPVNPSKVLAPLFSGSPLATPQPETLPSSRCLSLRACEPLEKHPLRASSSGEAPTVRSVLGRSAHCVLRPRPCFFPHGSVVSLCKKPALREPIFSSSLLC